MFDPGRESNAALLFLTPAVSICVDFVKAVPGTFQVTINFKKCNVGLCSIAVRNILGIYGHRCWSKRQKQKLERQEHTAEEKQKHRKEWKKRKRKAKRARAKTCSTADKEHITPKATMKLLPFQPKR